MPLAPLTTLGLGGPADRLVTAAGERELVEAVSAAGEPLLVLGGGSNLVVADAGFPGTVVRVCGGQVRVEADGDDALVTAEAGVDWDALVARCVAEGLAGIECLSGIPGLVGATPIQNVGAYGQEVAQTIAAVRVHDRRSGRTGPLTDLRLRYRGSRLKDEPGRWVVLAVTFRLRRDRLAAPVRPGELAGLLGSGRPPLEQVRAAVLALRRGKGMVLDPADPDSRSAGSFFTNPVVPAERAVPGGPAYPEPDGRVKLSAAWLIEQAGFPRGAFPGPVGLSGKHCLALVHRGGGTTEDLLRVARTVRDGVHDRFGVTLEPEPVLVGVRL